MVKIDLAQKIETPAGQEHSLGVSCITPEVIEALAQRIVTTINPRQIILFGSQARGDATAGSDVDLLVVQDTLRPDREVRRHIERLLLDRRFGLDLIVRTPEELARNLADGNPFYTEYIFGDGVVLYDRTTQETGSNTPRKEHVTSWCFWACAQTTMTLSPASQAIARF